jgi:hypothetical protein
VAPALFLNAFRNVHAIVKQDCDRRTRASDRRYEITDQHGQQHVIWYHRSPSAYLRDIHADHATYPLVFDLDLDYFTREHPSSDCSRRIALPDQRVGRTMDTKRAFMSTVLPRLVGMTIALEPRYSGGILNSLHLLEIVCRAIFHRGQQGGHR